MINNLCLSDFKLHYLWVPLRIVSKSSCKVTHKGTITETIEIMPQEPKNIIILRATTLAETSIHLRSLGKFKSQHLYRENWRIIVNVGHSE